MRIAVMQPYFIPYPGYFRLFAACDVFVIFDCVQFPRRGWVHRNQLLNHQGQHQWVTLPLQKCPQSTLIQDLAFALDWDSVWPQRLSKFPTLTQTSFQHRGLESLYQVLHYLQPNPVSYLSNVLKEICTILKIPFEVIRSSELPLTPQLRGQDKILEICRYFKARSYINAPNGRDLYCFKTFQHHGVNLTFLPYYTGSSLSILHRLLYDPIREISHDIITQSQPITG